MNLKDLVWFLCAIAHSTTREIHSDDDAVSYAYSSIYRSFDTPVITKEDTKAENSKTSSPADGDTVYISNSEYGTILTQEEKKPKPDEGAREITSAKTPDTKSNTNQDDKNVTEEPTTKSVPVKQTQATDSKNKSSISKTDRKEDNKTTTPVSAPAKATTRASPPLTMPIIQPGRLITPGLSAYANSKEEKEEKKHSAETDYNFDSKESYETFDGFGSW